MRMDLIQPFIGSLDAVLAEMMKAPAKIVDLTMEEEGYRRKGLRLPWSLFAGKSKAACDPGYGPRRCSAGCQLFFWQRSRSRPNRSLRKPFASLPTW